MAKETIKEPRRFGPNAIVSGIAALATALAAIVGTLRQLGYLGGGQPSPPTVVIAAPAALPMSASPAPREAVSPQAAAPPEVASVPSGSPAESPGRMTSLTGAWRDNGIGSCHVINQTGDTLHVTSYDPATGEVMSHGEGTVAGDHVEIQIGKHGAVKADFHISESGRTLFGKISRAKGTRRTLWRYLGQTCTSTNRAADP